MTARYLLPFDAPKPRIARLGGAWQCESRRAADWRLFFTRGLTHYGFGATPDAAYRAWVTSVGGQVLEVSDHAD